MPRFLFPSFVGYKRRFLRGDAAAALAVTALAVPESLAFAAIIGLPVQTGLYCALLAPIVFACLTASKRLVVGADSATAVLLASGASSVAAVGSNEYFAAVTALSLLAGVIVAMLGTARFGFLADLISRPVLVGFIGGVGLQLLVGKLPEMLGIEVHGSSIDKISILFTHITHVHIATAVVAALVLIAMFVAPKLKLPGALVGVVTALFAAYVFNLHDFDIKTIGAVTEGLPSFVLPSWSLDLISITLPSAFTIALVILAQSTATSRSFAVRHNEQTDDNRDLIALGFANIAAVFSQGFSINGSPPRSFAAEMNGGRSQMVNIFMAAYIGLILLFAAGTLERIPAAALAVVIAYVGFHLVRWRELRDIYKSNKTEFAIALIALLGVVVLGVQQGIIIAVGISLMERLRREYHPKDAVLLRDQALDEWATHRLDGNVIKGIKPAGLVVYHFDGAIFFENAAYFSSRLLEAVDTAHESVHNVILDAGSISDIDYTGAEEIRRCYKQLRADDTRLGLAHVSPNLKRLLVRYGLVELIGEENIYPTLHTAIKAHPQSKLSIIEMAKRLKLPRGSYVVIGGGVLEVLKVRETHDVDIVVSDKAYKIIAGRGWTEYIQDDGKRVLSRNGYKVMERWVHLDFKHIKRRSFSINGVAFMDLKDLLEAKLKLGRNKDLRDVRLIREYLREHDEDV